MKHGVPYHKHYDEMKRGEKRAYKRWLAKNELWDGAVVVENQEKSNKLFFNRLNYASTN